jgi:tetratricopeptide (TPR) repeat protein
MFIGLLGLANTTGCRTISRFRPADQKVIACREQSRLGIEALSRGETQEAEARLLHAIRGCPRDADARRTLAQIYLSQGRTDEAIAQMDLAVRLSGDDPLWTVELGEMLLADHKYTVAEECARRALARNPDLGTGWALLGDVCWSRADAQAAQHAYHRSLAAPGCPPRVLLSLADIYEKLGRHQRALAMLRQFEDTMGSELSAPHLAWRKGTLLQAMDRHEDALVFLQQAREQAGPSPTLMNQVAQSYQALGQLRSAEQALSEAQQLATSVQAASHEQR